FSVRNCAELRAIPGKVCDGFPSGIAQNSEQFQEKCVAVFRPELRRTKSRPARTAKLLPDRLAFRKFSR
ncbi:hypothetical protein, partial [Mesorhizobium sp. M6A.T.Cr.TU.017.01.1.1]|uniref:hypothetical protein n=1 Tax=Mesorhizobium sp. M6A.T.Cr.TU.017.01.1.1 TaxID=2496774 RepID=UPI0019D4BCFC